MSVHRTIGPLVLNLRIIMQTGPCNSNEYPLTPPFYIVKLGFTGIYLIFIFFRAALNIDCGYSLEAPHFEAVLTSTHNLCFRAKIRKNIYPYTPQFHYIKVGCKGVLITWRCYPDDTSLFVHFLNFVARNISPTPTYVKPMLGYKTFHLFLAFINVTLFLY